jgi:AcrR family transcriptional regulator
VHRYHGRVIEPKGRGGRPRSEQAREAVLHAVDDLLLEVGYAALTMKGIAERAGVGRQTVYRWWSTKAEILLEASAADAEEELAVPPADTPLAEVTAYLDALVRFLAHAPAGIAYRTLLGAAQHDPAVQQLLAANDVLAASARAVLARIAPAFAESKPGPEADAAAARLIGPAFFWVMSGREPGRLNTHALAQDFIRDLDQPAASMTSATGRRLV